MNLDANEKNISINKVLVKIFSGSSTNELETKINDWKRQRPGELIDIKFSSSMVLCGGSIYKDYSALITYKID